MAASAIRDPAIDTADASSTRSVDGCRCAGAKSILAVDVIRSSMGGIIAFSAIDSDILNGRQFAGLIFTNSEQVPGLA
jgi:hypothetical protein